MKYVLLYNPLAGKGKVDNVLKTIKGGIDQEITTVDMTQVTDYGDFFAKLDSEDKIIICGGDGTLNHFINITKDCDFENDIIYYAAGSGNDFMRDLGRSPEDGAFSVKQVIKTLPWVVVKGKKYRFINGVGFGVDGYVCQEGNRLRAKGKKVNYIGIALKGLLFAFKPVSATVTVDGKTHKFSRVWMTTAMKGKFFGGGMKIAPTQDRNNPEGKLSVIVAHNLGKLKIAMLFASIFKGEHVKYVKNVAIFTCHSIKVKYDKPCILQMDGETIKDVTEYAAFSSVKEMATV